MHPLMLQQVTKYYNVVWRNKAKSRDHDIWVSDIQIVQGLSQQCQTQEIAIETM